MSQLATPTIGFGTAPRTPLAVVPEAQAKRGWFEKTFSGKSVGVSLLLVLCNLLWMDFRRMLMIVLRVDIYL
jgi:hypothetical protein